MLSFRLSSWGATLSGLLEQKRRGRRGSGHCYLCRDHPLSLLPHGGVAHRAAGGDGVIPMVGAMRRAEELAERTGDLGVVRSRRSPLKTLVTAA